MAIDSLASPTTVPQGAPKKFLLFALGPLNLALPIDLVLKVLPHRPVYGSGLSDRALVNLDNRSLTAVDLYLRLFRRPQPPSEKLRQYFILLKNRQGEEFCLLVNDAPTLMDVLPSQIRALPASFRDHDSLRCASHVLLVEQQGEKFTVFLLDPDLLL